MTAAVACVGIATLDVVFAVGSAPSAPGKYRARERREVGGGVAANAAVTVARLGGEASLLSCVGDDRVGDQVVAGLAAEAVAIAGVRRVPGAASPLSFVLVDDRGERTVVNHASAHLFAGGTTPAEVAGAGAVLADMRWPEGAAPALAAARSAGVPAVLDCDHDPAGAEQLLKVATHVVFAAETLGAFVGCVDPYEALRRARSHTEGWVAATAGATGVFWLDGDDERHTPAFPVAAVDTLGAGDVFHGAFALRLAEGAALEPALRFAAAAAALKCTRFGGRAGIPTRAEVVAFMEES